MNGVVVDKSSHLAEGGIEMRQSVARGFENGRLKVLNHPQGKFIVYLPLNVQTVLPWGSIENLEKRAKDKVFEWTIEDGSLSVQGQQECWALAFTMSEPPHCSFTVSLSATETEAVKQHLFNKVNKQ